jgi:hypothetical protein
MFDSTSAIKFDEYNCDDSMVCEEDISVVTGNSQVVLNMPEIWFYHQPSENTPPMHYTGRKTATAIYQWINQLAADHAAADGSVNAPKPSSGYVSNIGQSSGQQNSLMPNDGRGDAAGMSVAQAGKLESKDNTRFIIMCVGGIGFMGVIFLNGGWRRSSVLPGYDNEARFNPRI